MTAAARVIDNDTILDRVARGDQGAIEECISRYGNMIWSLARRAFFRTEDAEDAVQEIFLAIWKNAHRFDPQKASESTFIAVIARRRLIDHLRASYRRPKTDTLDDHDLFTDSGERTLNMRMDASRAAAFLQDMRPEQKEIIWLKIYEGRSHGEIASIKKMPMGTVKTHLRRGLGRIREMMTQGRAPADHHVSAF